MLQILTHQGKKPLILITNQFFRVLRVGPFALFSPSHPLPSPTMTVQIVPFISGDIIPLDGPKKIINTKTFPVAVIGAIWAFSVCGIIMSIAFLVVNVYYGNVK